MPKFYIDLSPSIPNIPKFTDKTKVDVIYPLIYPYAYARIKYIPQVGDLVYFVLEPRLNNTEKQALELIEEGLKEVLNIGFSKFKDMKKALEYLENNVQFVMSELGIDLPEESYNKIMYYIFRDFIGLGPIEPLMHDPFIEDIECSGVNIPVFVVHRIFGNLRTNIIFKDEEELRKLIEKMAQRAGRYVSYAEPILDATLPDGSRVNATYTSDITTRGPTFTIRKFRKEPLTPVDLILNGTATPEIFAYFWLAIEYKRNILIIGPTAAGKTTFLNAILMFVPPTARIVTIEETREIQLYHENWIPAVSRPAFGLSGYGEVSLFDLLKASFRQRPDYVIVGEIRGEEAYVLFQGMASGHACLSTMHATDIKAVIRRLITPPINLPPSLVELLDIVASMTHFRDKTGSIKRVLKEAYEIIEVYQNGDTKYNIPFRYNFARNMFEFYGVSYVFKKISKEYGIPEEKLWEELKIRAKLLRRLAELGIKDYRVFSRVVQAYYINKEYVLSYYGIK